jgi:hypothetical protein
MVHAQGCPYGNTGRPQALFFHISIYTDDSGKEAISCERMVRLVRIWTQVCAELCILCVDPHKRGLWTLILSLGVILCHTLRGVFIPTAKVISACANLMDIHSSELTHFSKCREVFSLIGHFCYALAIVVWHVRPLCGRGIALRPPRRGGDMPSTAAQPSPPSAGGNSGQDGVAYASRSEGDRLAARPVASRRLPARRRTRGPSCQSPR